MDLFYAHVTRDVTIFTFRAVAGHVGSCMYLRIRYEYYFIYYQIIIAIARTNLNKAAISGGSISPRIPPKDALTISLKLFFTMSSKLVTGRSSLSLTSAASKIGLYASD